MKGASLIETVVALLLVSIVAAALATSTGSALRHEVHAERRERAAELAAEGLEQLLAEAPERLAPRSESETISIDGEPFSRERRIEPGPAPGLWRFTVVTRSSRGAAPVAIATLRHVEWTVP